MLKYDITRRGFTLIEGMMVSAVLAIIIAIVIPAIQRVRGASDKLYCQLQLRTIGQSIVHYQSIHGFYPTDVSTWGKPQPFMSWQTRILPYLDGGDQLWTQSLAAYAKEPLFWREPHLPIRATVI